MGIVVANFMDSSLVDLKKKGVFSGVAETYNPNCAYESVLHFTPHERDLSLAGDLASHRIELISHPITGLQPRKVVRTVMRLARIFRRRGVDIVRGRLPYMGSLMGTIAARLTGRPAVVSLGGDNRIGQERGQTYYLGSRSLSYGIEWLTLRLVSRIIVPNRFTFDYVASIIGAARAKRKCVVIPWLSPPVPEFDPEDAGRLAAFDIAPDRLVIPIVGFVNRYKYSDVLFDALADAPLQAPDGRTALFCFLGDGPLREEGEARFADRSDVRFLGWQDRSVVQTFLRRADLVLVPMSGFVLLEAASLGKAIISSRVEWHGEVIRDGETGYLVEPVQPQAWRDAIGQALKEEPERLARMAARVRALYEDEFALTVAVAREVALYESLTGKSAVAP